MRKTGARPARPPEHVRFARGLAKWLAGLVFLGLAYARVSAVFGPRRTGLVGQWRCVSSTGNALLAGSLRRFQRNGVLIHAGALQDRYGGRLVWTGHWKLSGDQLSWIPDGPYELPHRFEVLLRNHDQNLELRPEAAGEPEGLTTWERAD